MAYQMICSCWRVGTLCISMMNGHTRRSPLASAITPKTLKSRWRAKSCAKMWRSVGSSLANTGVRLRSIQSWTHARRSSSGLAAKSSSSASRSTGRSSVIACSIQTPGRHTPLPSRGMASSSSRIDALRTP
ncbi:hypothetical protein D3C86_1616040 [compost metagenome]